MRCLLSRAQCPAHKGTQRPRPGLGPQRPHQSLASFFSLVWEVGEGEVGEVGDVEVVVVVETSY